LCASDDLQGHSKLPTWEYWLQFAVLRADALFMILINCRNRPVPSPRLRFRERRGGVCLDDDAGFTLIELMVVLLILAILLAIAIPTFLGVTKSANDRAAQSNLNTALVNAKAAFQSNSQSYGIAVGGVTTPANFPTLFAATLGTAQPSLTFSAASTNAGTSTGQSTISVWVPADGNGIILAAQAKGTQNCWFMVDNAVTEPATANTGYANLPAAALAAGTWYGEAKNGTAVPTCNADAVPATSVASPVSFQGNGFPNL
jgi:type IV pilus assembly protein PilA